MSQRNNDNSNSNGNDNGNSNNNNSNGNNSNGNGDGDSNNNNNNNNGNGNGNGTTGGGTLDQAQTSSAAYIRSYAKTFSKFVAVYNHLSHLSHFHKPALDCDHYHIYVSCLSIQNILLVKTLVMSYDFK